MKDEFAILPWEYRGSGCDTTPHAFASLDVGGRKREFLLKMRGGIIYFKESQRSQIFAVLRQFESELRDDELIKAWSSEIERENFGRFLWRPLSFGGTPATTVIVSITRSDFSGWISDAFHISWLETPRRTGGKILDLWERNITHAINPAIERVRNSLLDRSMPSSERPIVPLRWVLGNEDELRHIFAVGMRLYARTRDGSAYSGYWGFAATNPASEGGFFNSAHSNKRGDLIFSPVLTDFLRLLQQHFVLVGIDWKHFNIMPDYASPLRPMVTRWGDDWRGNYQLDTPTILFPAPLVASLSGHERLKLKSELRNWLSDKSTPSQIANLLAGVLE